MSSKLLFALQKLFFCIVGLYLVYQSSRKLSPELYPLFEAMIGFYLLSVDPQPSKESD